MVLFNSLNHQAKTISRTPNNKVTPFTFGDVHLSLDLIIIIVIQLQLVISIHISETCWNTDLEEQDT